MKKIQIILSSMFGGAVVGALLTPIIDYIIRTLFIVYDASLSSFIIAAGLGALVGYFIGLSNYRRYLINPASVEASLPKTNWYLILTTMVLVIIVAFVFSYYSYFTNGEQKIGCDFGLCSFAAGFFALVGAFGAVIVSMLLSFIPKLKSRGVRNFVLIFAISFTLIFSIILKIVFV